MFSKGLRVVVFFSSELDRKLIKLVLRKNSEFIFSISKVKTDVIERVIISCTYETVLDQQLVNGSKIE